MTSYPNPDPDYFLDNYGTCKLAECECRREKNPRFDGLWVGRVCPDFVSAGLTSYEELFDYVRNKHPTYGLRKE